MSNKEAQFNDIKTNDAEEKKHDPLVVACISSIKCECGACQLNQGENIYMCKKAQCASKYYCSECGPFMHRAKSKKNHSFSISSQHVLCVNTMIKKNPDWSNFESGKQMLISLIGVTMYNKIASKVENEASCAATHGTAVVMFGIEYVQTLRAASFQTLIHPSHVINAGMIGAGIVTAIEIGIHCYRYTRRDISGKELARLTGRAICRNACSSVGIIIGCKSGVLLGVKTGAVCGAKIGAAIGTAANPGIGTAIGTGIGVTLGLFGGLISGFLMGKGAEAIYDEWIPETEQATRKKMLQEALLYFQLQPKDIRNDQIFNKIWLKKKFKRLALDAHPDRRGGDDTEWYRLSGFYGVLKALLDESDKNKIVAMKELMVSHKK